MLFLGDSLNHWSQTRNNCTFYSEHVHCTFVVVTCNYLTCWLFNWLLNVTFNDISVIYVTAHKCAGGLNDKVTVGLPTPQGSLRCPIDQGHVVSLPTTGPLYGTMGFDLTTYIYGWSLCRKHRPQVQRYNTCTLRQWSQNPQSLFTTRMGIRKAYSFKPLSPHEEITISRIQSTTCTIRLSNIVSYISHLGNLNILIEISVFVTIFYKIHLATFTCIIPLNLSTFSECEYSYQPSKLIIRSLISVLRSCVLALDAITKPI